jgi:hypothetical protein
MPCLLGCIALSAPRLVLFFLWLVTSYLDNVWETRLWPFLGFVFLPLTTLAYAFAWHQGNGSITAFGTACIVTAFIIDIGLFGTGNRARKSRQREIVVKGERVG